MDESQSPSGPDDPRGEAPRRRRYLRDAWRDLNAAQLVCIATGTVAALFGLFGGVLVLLSALLSRRDLVGTSITRTAMMPSFVALACAAGAMIFTRSSVTRRAARQECGPAVLMALTGLLGVAIAWVIA